MGALGMIQTLSLVSQDVLANYHAWKTERDRWKSRADICRQYYEHDVDETFTTYTKEQLEKIKNELSNLPISTDLIHSTIQQRVALLAANKYATRIVANKTEAMPYAQVLDKAVHSVLYHSHFLSQVEQVIKDLHIAGHGYLLVEEADKFYESEFGINVKHQLYDSVILDANMSSAACDDMEGFFIEKEVTEAKLKRQFQAVFEKLGIDNLSIFGDADFSGQPSDRLTASTISPIRKYVVRSYYDYEFTTMYLVENSNGEVEQLFAENLDEEALPLLAGAIEVPDYYVRQRIYIGNYLVYQRMLPLTRLPLVVLYYDFNGRPYRSYGLVHYLINLQEANDKILQLMITNGILTNNAGYIAPVGAIDREQRKRWETLGNKPGVIKEYNPKVIEGNILKPEREQIQGISNFFPTIFQITYKAIQDSSGISPVLSGDSQSAGIEIFSTLRAYQDAAMQRVVLTSQKINTAMELLGRILVEYLIATITRGTYIYFDPENEEVNEIVIAEGINNFKLNKFNVVAVPSTMTQTQRLGYAESLLKIAQSSQEPYVRNVLTVEGLKLADMPNAKQLLSKIDAVAQMQAQLEQMQQALKRQQELTKQMENRLVNSEIENEILKKAQTKLINLAHKFGQQEQELSMVNELKPKEE